MPKAKRLIVGLGNPGSEYEATRHNVGFMVVDALAESLGWRFELDRGPSLVAWGSLRGCPVGLAKPQAYMNRSGGVVKGLVGRGGIDLSDLLVVYDDINLEPGRLRLRPGGSAGGHNGIQDLIDRLGTQDFPRLRIGIGSEFSRGRQADYVLSPFDRAQQPLVEEAVARAVDAIRVFVAEGLNPAMNRFNT